MADVGQTTGGDTRTRALVLEVELPEFYVDDLPELLAEDGWDDEPLGDQILRGIGEVYSGLLTVEVSGEKDSEITRTPVLVIGARVEERPPDGDLKHLEQFAARVDEPVEEQRVTGKINAARARIYERLLRQLAAEYTGQVSQLAQQALQEAALKEDEIEAAEWPH